MSRRSSRRDRADVRPRPGPAYQARDVERPLAERLATTSVRAAALLPLRFFLGVTFLYAGLDKLLDPAFFDQADPASIQAQLVAFGRASPIGELVRLAEPFAVEVGLIVAIAEIGIGLGLLLGLAFRVAAAGGVALSLMFWLTASWATHPYYYGPDLPYAAGMLTLALAGTGGLLVPAPFRTRSTAAGRRPDPRRPEPGPEIERRTVLQTGFLALAAIGVAATAMSLRFLGVKVSSRTGSVGSPPPSVAPSVAPSTGPTADATSVSHASPPAGIPVATVAQVDRRGTASFTVPLRAPAPLPAGDPGIIVRLADGTYVAFDAVCTHAGCTVEYDTASGDLVCPCHGATFDPTNDAAVLAGPTDQPLAPLPIVVDPTSGRILLTT